MPDITAVKRFLVAVTSVTAIPYLIAFVLVTGIAWVAGKIPTRRNKLILLPVLEVLCACFTLLVSIGLLRVFGLREPYCTWTASVGWIVFYGQRVTRVVEFGRALAGLVAGWGLYRWS
jgi:hypothetical protein